MADALFESLEGRRLLAVNVTVNGGARFQQIDGFGTSMAWWVPGVYDNDAWRNAYYQDLGSSMLRMDLNLNALPGSDGDVTTPVVMGEDLQTNINQFNWNAVVLQRFGGVAKGAASKKIDQFKLFATVSSPPHWMKGEERNADTGAFNGKQPLLTTNTNWGYNIYDSCGGSLVDTPANLQQFGRYVAAYVKGLEQQWGTPVYALSIQNELAFREPYNSSVYDPALYVKTLKAVVDAFDHYGIATKLMGPEDVGVGSTSNPWVLKRQMKYIDAVRADAEAMKDLDLYAIHGYADDGITDNRSPAMWGQYWNGRPASQYPNPAGANWVGIKNDGKKSWLTESSGEAPTWDGALRLAAGAQDALVQGNVSAWAYWQMSESNVLNHQALTAGSDTTAAKYNAAKHFFRYIRPGAVRVLTTASDPTGVYTSAFVHDANKTLTGVLMNLGSTPQTVNLTLGGVSVSTFGIARQSSAAGVWKDLGPITISNGVATITLPAGSIVTIQGSTNVPVIGGSIAGNLWNDADADGFKDAGETPLANWKLFLDADKDGVLDAGEKTTLTDAAGNYKFAALAAASYRVREVLSYGWRRTSPASGYHDVTLAAGQNVAAKNFGNTQNVQITGTLWNDLDGDGVKDAGEPPLSAWKIFIDADKDGVLDVGETSTTTNASGNYAFNTLKAGSYRVRQIIPTGWRRTTLAASYDLTLGNGAISANRNFGNTTKVLIAGSVFNDLDGDGFRDAAEGGLSAWRIFLDADNDGVLDATERSILTDAAGNWSFKDLVAGSYRVRVVQQAGWKRTSPALGYHAITLAPGQSSMGKSFGEKRIA